MMMQLVSSLLLCCTQAENTRAAVQQLPGKWHLIVSGGAMTIVSALAQNKCLDLPGGSTNNGNNLWIWDCNGEKNQQWVFGSGTWKIQYAANPSKCVDALGWKGAGGAGTQLGIWDCNEQSSQKWGYDSTMKSIYLAASESNANLCMDLTYGNQKDGTKVQAWNCNSHSNQVWDIQGVGPAPTPGPATDLHLSWPEGGGHGACQGQAVQGSNVIQTNGNDITITTDNAPSGSCVYRNAQPSINLDDYPHVEVDLQTFGNKAIYGQKSGMWFSFWMFPPSYAYKHGISESGEVDFVENINSVRTNFAGCKHDCHETSWSESANDVSAHITMHYDKGSEFVNVYRCAHGASTCGTSGDHAYIDLAKMQIQKPYIYTFSADVWYAKPGFGFKLVVSNLRILRNAVVSNSSETFSLASRKHGNSTAFIV